MEKCKKHCWIVDDNDHNFNICGVCGKRKSTIRTKFYPSRWGDVLSFDGMKEKALADDKSYNDTSDEWKDAEDIENISDEGIALDKLPEQQRKVVQMEKEGFNAEEISKVLGVDIKVVWKYKNRAKNKLKKWIQN